MNRRVSLFVLLAGLFLFSSCSNPAADKPKATTGEAAPVSQSPIGTEKYLVSSDTSKIEFTASQVTASHHGSFGKFSGSVDFAGQPEKSRESITIDTSSVSTDTPELTAHLKTPDFFDVAKFPEATFVSTEKKPGGDKGATHTVTGNLQLHGVTKAITFPASITVSPGAINVESTFSINRKDFGINYAGVANNLIRDEVVLMLHVKASK